MLYFFIEKRFLGKKSANTHTITAGKFNIFNDGSPCARHENSLALENVLMKNPCVFSLQVFATLFYGGNFITHICFFTWWISSGFIKILIRLSCIKILKRHFKQFLDRISISGWFLRSINSRQGDLLSEIQRQFQNWFKLIFSVNEAKSWNIWQHQQRAP